MPDRNMKIKEESIPALIRSQHDREVIKHLYKKLLPSVQRYITKNNGIADDAYDVFQEAIMYFYNQVVQKKFNEEKYNVYGYIYKVAIARWINKLNKDRRMVFKNEVPEYLKQHTNEAFLYRQDEERNIVKKFLSHIGERCVELLTYRIYSNMMFDDIMLQMDFNTVGAAKMSYKRCREKLVQVVKKYPHLADELRNA